MARKTALLVSLSWIVFNAAALAEGLGQDFSPSTKGKKLIEYGWDCPNTAFLRKNIRQMEKRPFDGVIFQVANQDPNKLFGNKSLGWGTFGKYRFQPEDYQRAIEDLKATKFEKFTDNFVQVISMPGIDWFDSEWESVCHNIKVLARIAKAGGCAGLMFDPEEYGSLKIWTYHNLSDELKKAHTEAQYRDQAKKRGEEFMRAINSEYPGITILCLLGPSFDRENEDYGLLPAFYEGMCREADPNSRIIDGYEQAYHFKQEADFRFGRKVMKEEARKFFSDSSLYDKFIRPGFGLFLDAKSRENGWHPDEPEKNFFTAEQWEKSVNLALLYSDEYVWIYSERLSWWKSPPTAGELYEQAQQGARR